MQLHMYNIKLSCTLLLLYLNIIFIYISGERLQVLGRLNFFGKNVHKKTMLKLAKCFLPHNTDKMLWVQVGSIW